MKARHFIVGATIIGAALLGLEPAHATPITVIWDFSTYLGDRGTTQTYTSTPVGGGSIIATAECTSCDLFGKNLGSTEKGLGLTNDPSGENEITSGSWIQLDLSGLSSPPLLSLTFSFQANSVQSPDEWAVYGSNTAGTLGTQIDTGFDNSLVASLPGSILGTYTYLNVTALEGNILLSELDNSVAPSVPEPASLALLGVGLLGFGVFQLRRDRREAARSKPTSV